MREAWIKPEAFGQPGHANELVADCGTQQGRWKRLGVQRDPIPRWERLRVQRHPVPRWERLGVQRHPVEPPAVRDNVPNLGQSPPDEGKQLSVHGHGASLSINVDK
jgi:hypothetical protein